MGRKISPKIQQTAEKYLASLGSSREQLTENQWEIIANYVKTRRMKVPILLVGGLFCACMGFLYFRIAKTHITAVLQKQAIFVSEFKEDSPMPLKPDYIEKNIDAIKHAYLMIGCLYMLTLFSFASIFIMVPLSRRGTKKMLKAFIPRKQEQGAIHPENQMSSE